MRQLALPVGLRAGAVFESFFSGLNLDVVRQLKDLAPGRPPVVWLYGPAASGKTHLLQAVCAQAGRHGVPATYIPLRDAAARPELLSGCETLAFVCLDDFDAIVGDGAWERALFRLYTELDESGGRIVIGATAPPAAFEIALRDLASRVAAGTVLRLRSLNDDDLASALTLRAEQLGLQMPADVAQFLLRRLPRDMASVCAALERLDQASLASQRRLTVPFVRDVLDGVISATAGGATE